MTIFKTFLRILQKNIVVVIISTLMLLIFGGFNMAADNNIGEFVDDKPDVTIINHDQDEGITHGLIEYLGSKTNLIEITDDEAKLKDALFYRETNFIIYIPENYNADFLNGENPEIQFQSTGDYQAAFAEMILTNYLKVIEIYRDTLVDSGANSDGMNLSELTSKINDSAMRSLESDMSVVITSQVDTASMSRAAIFFNFESYALLNSLIFIIAIIMIAFNEPKVYRRLLVSSMKSSRQSRILLLAIFLFADIIWLLYLVLGYVLLGGDTLMSLQGCWFVLSSFIFMLCATSLAFLVGTLVRNRNAVNGIVNVIALGSSFLCGAFVPQAWLPGGVLAFAHLLPTYYYIDANNTIAEMEGLGEEASWKLAVDFGMMILFTLLFVGLTIIIPKIRQKLKKM